MPPYAARTVTRAVHALPTRFYKNLVFGYLGRPETPFGVIGSTDVASASGGYLGRYLVPRSFSINARDGYTIGITFVTSTAALNNDMLITLHAPLGNRGIEVQPGSLGITWNVVGSNNVADLVGLTMSLTNCAGTNDCRNRVHRVVHVLHPQSLYVSLWGDGTLGNSAAITNAYFRWTTVATFAFQGGAGGATTSFSGTVHCLYVFNRPFDVTDVRALDRGMMGAHLQPE